MRNKQNKIAHITTITFSLYFPGSNSPLYSHLIYSCNMVGWEEENEDYGLYMSVCFFSSSSYFSFKPAWIVNGVPCPPLSPKYRISSTSCSDLGVPSAACLLGLAFYFFFFHSLLCMSIIVVIYLIYLPIGDTSLAAGFCHESAGSVCPLCIA